VSLQGELDVYQTLSFESNGKNDRQYYKIV
jgi:hypothetical protein